MVVTGGICYRKNINPFLFISVFTHCYDLDGVQTDEIEKMESSSNHTVVHMQQPNIFISGH